jgi:hypothetical protein
MHQGLATVESQYIPLYPEDQMGRKLEGQYCQSPGILGAMTAVPLRNTRKEGTRRNKYPTFLSFCPAAGVNACY